MSSRKRNLFSELEGAAAKMRRRTPRSEAVAAGGGPLQVDSIYFKDIWRILLRKGWSSKPPTLRGLDNRHRYFPPGGCLDGQEGADYFLGEKALMTYYLSKYQASTMIENDASATSALVISDDRPDDVGADVGRGGRDEVQVALESAVIIGEPHSGGSGGGGYAAGDTDHVCVANSGGGADRRRSPGRGEDAGAEQVSAASEEAALEGASSTGEHGAGGVGGYTAANTDHVGVAHAGGGADGGRGRGRGRVAGRVVGRGAGRGAGDEQSAALADSTGGAAGASTFSSNNIADGMTNGEFSYEMGMNEVESRILSPQFGQNTIASISPPARGPEVYVGSLVAYTPSKSKWLLTKKLESTFKPVGTAYIVGRVCRRVVEKQTILFEVRWLDSMFQQHAHCVSLGILQQGIENYRLLTKVAAKPSWKALTTAPGDEDIPDGVMLEDLVETDEDLVAFDSYQPLPASLKEVELVKSMRFDPCIQMKAPSDLYSHSSGSTTTHVRAEYVHLFTHSASSSFLAYVPVYFWQQVVNESNAYAKINGVNLVQPVTLAQLMKFIGILFFMTINDKDEYSNYWGSQPDDAILGNLHSSGLENIMPLRRFKLLRKVFCFRAAPPSIERDPAARIRPLLNLLKCTGGKYIDMGRNVALDECSVACRSKYGRHVIMYNPMKPTGKYHFRLYVLCCATTWIAVNYRFHCNSSMADRLSGVVSVEMAQGLSNELLAAKVSSIRKLVLEVVRPIYGSHRIVNMDNYYTSVQLLQALHLKGLYARGTVGSTSKHSPKHTVLDKNEARRGNFRQGVSDEHGMQAASWCDGSIVQMISNADPSSIGTVERQVGGTAQTFPAPACVKEYNQHMQGVDRLDQIRGRFPIADGHSYKKWHKKLALALIDIARANAYLTRRQLLDVSKERDPHRQFMIELASELISGRWIDAPSDGRIAFDATGASELNSPSIPLNRIISSVQPTGSPQKRCTAVTSRQVLGDRSRNRRACIVCRWEERYATEKTDYCGSHNLCLCRGIYQQEPAAYMCPDTDLTCWEKYHRFYFPSKLFSDKGNLRRMAELYKLKESCTTSQAAQTSHETDERSVDSALD